MTSRHHAQRLAEHLIRRACRHLPDDTRDDRYREWAAELPAILRDPDIRFRLNRSARALLYAADHHRGTRRLPRTSTTPRARAVLTRLVPVFSKSAVSAWIRPVIAVAGAVGIVVAGVFALGEAQQFLTPVNQVTHHTPHTAPDNALLYILIGSLLAVAVVMAAAALSTLHARRRRARGRVL
jgi:hypothetical protein